MKMPAIVTSIVLLMSAITANAQSPAFTAAANGWLNGPEASNLEKLSGLANAGDTDAQILLGQIDRDTVPGGFSESSWKKRRIPTRLTLLSPSM